MVRCHMGSFGLDIYFMDIKVGVIVWMMHQDEYCKQNNALYMEQLTIQHRSTSQNNYI